MTSLIVMVLSTFFLLASATPPLAPFSPQCMVGQPSLYDPAKSYQVPWYTVNLDAEPRERFKHVVAHYAQEIREGIAIIRQMLGLFGDTPFEVINYMMQIAYDTRLTQPYKDEITGMSEVTGIPASELTMMNMFYELSRFCTSIIAQTETGTLYHARNLDFGQLFWWNITTRSWGMTDKLKQLTVNINFVQNGRLATTFAGHAGVITAMKPNKFSLSMNARLSPDIDSVIQWVSGGLASVHFAMYIDREVMEQTDSYAEARDFLSTTPLMTGSYYILGGAHPGEGTVISRNATSVVGERFLDPSQPNGWYVLQTNYDTDQTPLFLDDRRTPGNSCMRQLGQKNVNAAGIYQVLSSKTNLNKCTVHTVLMSTNTGLYETYIQYCPDPCWFL